ncbi:MAG: hypothetical protein HY391_00670 [Deltaproteobacteria bacterium]|nr:hypothetical protein [Deltaproteobacteria bacterium]
MKHFILSLALVGSIFFDSPKCLSDEPDSHLKSVDEAAVEIVERAKFRDGIRYDIESMIDDVRSYRDHIDYGEPFCNLLADRLFELLPDSPPQNDVRYRFVETAVRIESNAITEGQNRLDDIVKGIRISKWDRMVRPELFYRFLQEYVSSSQYKPTHRDRVERLAQRYLYGLGTPAALIAGYLDLLNQDGSFRWRGEARSILQQKFPNQSPTGLVRFGSEAERSYLLSQLNEDNDRGGRVRRVVMEYFVPSSE